MAKKIRKPKEKTLEEKVKKATTVEEKNQENFKKTLIVKQAKENLLAKYQSELPELMDKKLEKIAYELADISKVEGITNIEINEILRGETFGLGVSSRYTADQLDIIFEAYRQALVEINRVTPMIPTKENFCAFAGISVALYNKWLSDIIDEDKMEMMNRIDDYIKDNQLTAAQLGHTKEVTTIFRAKAAHGMVEASAPQVVVHKSEVNLDKINDVIEQVKKGKSLKSIELKKNGEGTYE